MFFAPTSPRTFHFPSRFHTGWAMVHVIALLAACSAQPRTPPIGVRMCAAASTAAPPPRTVRLIPDLKAADFQHPDDKRASDALQLLGPVSWGMRQAFKTFVDDAVFMENIASGVLVGP